MRLSDEAGAVNELEAIVGEKEAVGKLRRFSFNQGRRKHGLDDAWARSRLPLRSLANHIALDDNI